MVDRHRRRGGEEGNEADFFSVVRILAVTEHARLLECLNTRDLHVQWSVFASRQRDIPRPVPFMAVYAAVRSPGHTPRRGDSAVRTTRAPLLGSIVDVLVLLLRSCQIHALDWPAAWRLSSFPTAVMHQWAQEASGIAHSRKALLDSCSHLHPLRVRTVVAAAGRETAQQTRQCTMDCSLCEFPWSWRLCVLRRWERMAAQSD